jgi:hypothetical protein
MAVAPGSRYDSLAIFDVADAQGEVHATVAIRPNPTTAPAATYQRTVAVVDTLESLAWSCYHSSQAWWRIADANPRVFPLDWRPADVVVIPVLSTSGLVQRTRRF